MLSTLHCDAVIAIITEHLFSVTDVRSLSESRAIELSIVLSTAPHNDSHEITTALKFALQKFSEDNRIDVALRPAALHRIGLAVFDMDSTLIRAEVIDELAKRAGVGDAVATITAAAMRGELSFAESFTERLSLLRGLSENVLESIAENLPVMDGAERLFAALHATGCRTAILSGGFTYFARSLARRFGIDDVYANELDIENGHLTGRANGDIIDGKKKADLLLMLAEKHRLPLTQTLAVGDGANDLPMISLAGLGIAFHAKPLVKAQAPISLNALGLDSILYVLGFSDAEIAALQSTSAVLPQPQDSNITL
jgi:phosphoserine phosphatase